MRQEFRKIRLVKNGIAAPSSGTKNPPCCVIAFFFFNAFTFLSATRRIIDFFFCRHLYWLADNGTLPLSTFKDSSHRALIKSGVALLIISRRAWGLDLYSSSMRDRFLFTRADIATFCASLGDTLLACRTANQF